MCYNVRNSRIREGAMVSSKSEKIHKLTGLALLAALIAVLQLLASFIKFGPVSITLALVPIIIGAALYGVGAGTFLGFVFGAVTFIYGIAGFDGGFVLLLMSYNTPLAILLCFGKATLAGLAAGLVYKLLSGKNDIVAVIVSGVTAPVVNTGLFVAGMLGFFVPIITQLADGSGKTAVAFLLLTMIGINFIIELVVNMLLASAITRIITVLQKRRKV